MMKNYYYLILLLCINCSKIEGKQNRTLLKEVFKSAKEFADLKRQEDSTGQSLYTKSHYEYFNDFNFRTFEPVSSHLSESRLDSGYFYRLTYDTEGKVREILHYEKSTKLTRFRLEIDNTPKYKIMAIFDLPETSSEDTSIMEKISVKSSSFSGFMVYIKHSQKIYFINTAARVLNQHFRYDPIYPVFRLNEIACICKIDSNFYLEGVIRIHKFGKIENFSQIQYIENPKRAMRELVWFYGQQFPEEMSLEDENLSFEYLEEIIEKYKTEYTPQKFIPNPGSVPCPLIVYEGMHHIKLEK